MNRQQIVKEINEAKADLTKGSNAHNMAQNRLEVLTILLWRWDNTNWYDKESDFKSACTNIVEELIELELENNLEPVEPKDERFIFR